MELAGKEFTPVVSEQEMIFLEGPHSRWKELKFSVAVLLEFIYGFRKLNFVRPCVTVFGLARFTKHHPYYAEARQIGGEIAKLGFTVITGGGPDLFLFTDSVIEAM